MEQENENIKYMDNNLENPYNDDEVEKEGLDNSFDKLMDKPFDPTKIDIDTKTPSLDTLIKRIRNKAVRLNTDSYFQRKDNLWDVVKQSRLIESILIRFPLPAFYFDATNESEWLVVDGLQRLSSIRNFIVDKSLKLQNLEFLTHLNNSGWDDLSENLQRTIEEAQVVIYKIMPGTPTDVKFNIFKRINTGGLALEPQEIRHALFQGTPANFIAELAQMNEFKDATGGKINPDRMLDRDFVNRFLAFYLLGVENYQPDLDTYMSRAMAGLTDKTPEELVKIKNDFKKALVLSKKIFGKETFRKVYYKNYTRRPPINKALFDTITTQFGLLTDSETILIEQNKAKIKKGLFTLLSKDEYFFASVTSSTGDKRKTLYRHSKFRNLIEDTI